MPADRSDSDFNFGTRESPANMPGERKYTLLEWKAAFWVNASPSSIRTTTVKLPDRTQFAPAGKSEVIARPRRSFNNWQALSEPLQPNCRLYRRSSVTPPGIHQALWSSISLPNFRAC